MQKCSAVQKPCTHSSGFQRQIAAPVWLCLPTWRCLPFSYLQFRQAGDIAQGMQHQVVYSCFAKEPLQHTTLSAVENFQKCCKLLPFHFIRSVWQKFISRTYIKRLKLLAQLQSQLSLLLISVQWMTPFSITVFQIYGNLTCVRRVTWQMTQWSGCSYHTS